MAKKSKNGNGKDLGFIDEVAEQILSVSGSGDTALSGRMMANDPKFNVDAALQVAHAISTNKAPTDFDSFTTIDDLPGEASGAGMMGDVAFNSPCFYSYATIDIDQLLGNLQGQTDIANATVGAFTKAFIESIPTGKRNTFGNNCLPDFVSVIVRSSKRSRSLVNAFLLPIWGKQKGLMQESIDKMVEYLEATDRVYSNKDVVAAAAFSTMAVPAYMPTVPTMNDLVSLVGEIVAKYYNGKRNGMIVEFHKIQNFPPSCVNRDVNGNPKNADFGGYTRGRVSSQCIKHFVRKYIKENNLLPEENISIRTKRVVSLVMDSLTKKGKNPEEVKYVVKGLLSAIASADKKRPGEASYMLHLSPNGINLIRETCLNHWDVLLDAGHSAKEDDDAAPDADAGNEE